MRMGWGDSLVLGSPARYPQIKPTSGGAGTTEYE
jgi:hypothetical protein